MRTWMSVAGVGTFLALGGIIGSGNAYACYSISVSASPVAVCYNGHTSHIIAVVDGSDVQNHQITFTVQGPADPGTVSPQSDMTDPSGCARTTYTSGADCGTVTLTATDQTEPANPLHSATCTVIVFKLTQSDVLWRFNGVTPPDYATEVTLTAYGLGTGSFYWNVGQGFDKAGLVDGANLVQSVTRTNSNTVNLRSKAPSADLYDVHVQFKWNGIEIVTWTTTVRSPDHLHHIRDDDQPNLEGYASYIHYYIHDQFHVTLPRDVPLNERWTSDEVSDWPGETWQQGEQGWCIVDPDDWMDCAAAAWMGLTPTPQNPQTPLGNSKVDHWGQRWYVGSTATGQGKSVHDDTLQFYRDHGRHE